MNILPKPGLHIFSSWHESVSALSGRRHSGVKHVSSDYRHIIVQMKLRWYNGNYYHTHFGGSLYAMTDPFLVLMLIQILGNTYIIWDKYGAIDFVKPSKDIMTAHFRLSDADIAEIKEKTANGEKYLPQFVIDVVDQSGELVAQVTKTLYIRKKRRETYPCLKLEFVFCWRMIIPLYGMGLLLF